MKKALAIILLLAGSISGAQAGHIAGGEMYYRYVGPGVAPNTDRFEITLRLFRECSASGPNVAAMPTEVIIGIFGRTSLSAYNLHSSFTVQRTSLQQISITPSAYPCIVPAPNVCYQIGYFVVQRDLPRNEFGYTVSFQTCCRSGNILNMFEQPLPNGTSGDGATYVGNIPGMGLVPESRRNSSPVFAVKDTAVVCQNSQLTLDFSANDQDGDSLSYSFCSAYNRGDATSSANITPSTPPYFNISYTSGFSGSRPLGPNVTINPRTGLISGLAPGAGKYVINVCIDEWRNGVKISEHRKDFTLRVESCVVADAALNPSYITCDGYTMGFENLTNSPLIETWYWDFGVQGTDTDTSTQEFPTFTYPDTGTYTLKLVVNRNGQCKDSTTASVKVYPGFFPDFNVDGACKDIPFRFIDATSTNYGTVTGWRWSFGDETTTADSSRLQNPQWQYATTGTKNVRLIVGNTKGCIDTVFKDVVVFDKPPIDLPFKDTLICSIDTLQLLANGTGSFSWGPNYNIQNANTSSPLVWPKTTTTYNVTLNDRGCIGTDTVRVRVVDFVTLSPPIDTTICLTDSVTLRPVTDGLKFLWSPAGTLDDPTKKNPIAIPVDPVTIYSVTASIGKCNASANMTVRTVPYPSADAGADVIICYDDTIQLNAQMQASSFTWTPANTLINPNTLTPLAFPLSTTNYILTVRDVLGCPKPFSDTVMVTVRPKIRAFAGNDTAIVVGQPLQLNATGSMLYTWTPSTGLNRDNIPNPVAVLNESMTYVVRVYTPENCEAYDTINIVVFKTKPDIFVPNAFTPGKRTNNLFRPAKTPGISKLDFFRVYNRWGQMVFSTNEIGRGWDGTIAGKPQDSGTFVWIVQGTDFTGKVVFKKGTMVLIR
ncbi:MAG TPA: PKD domain-containing protein [Chitinophagaceae bacterium]